MRVANRLFDALCVFGLHMSALSLIGIVLIVALDVVSRNFLHRSLSWSDDLEGYLFCYSIFCALPEITRRGGHITIDFIVDRLGARKLVWSRFLDQVSAAVCLVAAYFSFMEMVRQFEANIETIGIFIIPKWILTLVIGSGFGLSALGFLLGGGRRPSVVDRPPCSPDDRCNDDGRCF